MYYEAELRFLRDIFRKCRIHTSLVEPSAPLNTRQDLELYAFLQNLVDTTVPLQQILPAVEPAVIYRLTDPLFCQYLYLQLPEIPSQPLLLIGPFFSHTPSDGELLGWLEKSSVSIEGQKLLMEYYRSVPVLPSSSHLYMALDTFAEHLWGTSNYQFQQIDRESLPLLCPLQLKSSLSQEKDALWNVRNMELRYSYENEMMNAVSKGQLHKAEMLLGNFATFPFEQRSADPIRNLKNYCIIMNTLLRKAAEQGGVHPVYLDSQSSLFANSIEQYNSQEQLHSLMTEMFRSYCQLVRSYTVKHYSPPIQKVITMIDSDLTGDLSLRHFAQLLNVSGSYLSTLFKKETGQNLTEYINDRRIKYATHLLRTTQLQIQTVAQQCGIMDVQYFSKVFKRYTGKSPKEYRETVKH